MRAVRPGEAPIQARSPLESPAGDRALAELHRLRVENARLIALLDAHGIAWQTPLTANEARPPADTRPAQSDPSPLQSALTLQSALPAGRAAAVAPPSPQQRAASSELPVARTTEEKIALFGRRFQGRTDVYPVRWEGKAGKSGYSPACANDGRPAVCRKPEIKCRDCGHREPLPLTAKVLIDHLSGHATIGVYPLLPDDCCHFLAVDFDDAGWREDAVAFARSCRELDVPVALEISRSGDGAHAWVFFSSKVKARDARRLGAALISHTCAQTRQLELKSYDRLFPSQDTLPKGGYGNLIALPLQKGPRKQGHSLFVNDALEPHRGQMAFLASLPTMAAQDIEPAVLRATCGGHPLDVDFIEEEDLREPWKRPRTQARVLPGPMPASLGLILANKVYVNKTGLPQALANRLIRLAAFRNPEFHKAEAMRRPVWNIPSVTGCAENYPQHIALPRGCLDATRQLLKDNGIRCDLTDGRLAGKALDVRFTGSLRPDQEAAVTAMLRHDTGVLRAPTAFGKTVVASALIARRGVDTLVLVHRKELLQQWQERLQAFLDLPRGSIGTVSAGRRKPSGRIDIAVMQSLYRLGVTSDLVENYGQIIVDECHHVSAKSIEAILKAVRSRYVLGLTATPIRRDGQQPIIFMQCGPTRHTAARPAGMPQVLEVLPRYRSDPVDVAEDASIQDVFRTLARDEIRTRAIANETVAAWSRGRKVLVLTERNDHLVAIAAALRENASGHALEPFILHGRMPRRRRSAVIAELAALPPEAPRVLLATGRLVGEGFDHPPLDTLVLSMPISWRGSLQQYAGRLHREQAGKSHVRIIDFVDTGHPILLRMWDRRRRGYRAMGYQVPDASPGQACIGALDFGH